MYSFFGSRLVPSYSAAKGAIVQLTKSMAIELAPHNIQVNAIAPGWIETDMTAPVRTTPMNDEILARTPAGRWGQPEELAGTAVYLASRASDFVTELRFVSMAVMRFDNDFMQSYWLICASQRRRAAFLPPAIVASARV